MRNPKDKNKKKYKIKTPKEAKIQYLIYLEGIFFLELREGLGTNHSF